MDQNDQQIFCAVIITCLNNKESMYPLNEGNKPIPLLPLANRPLISYQLELLENCGITNVIIVCAQRDKEKLEIFINSMYTGDCQCKIIPTDNDSGTAQALACASKDIKGDFIVLAGDLVLDDKNISHLLDIHLSNNSALTVLLKRPKINLNSKIKRKTSTDFIGLDSTSMSDPETIRARLVASERAKNIKSNNNNNKNNNNNNNNKKKKNNNKKNNNNNEEIIPTGTECAKLVYWMPSQLKADSKYLTISRALLFEFPNLTIHNDLLDCAFYVCSHWILKIFHMLELSVENSITMTLIPKLLQFQCIDDIEELPQEIVTEIEKNELEYYDILNKDPLEKIKGRLSNYACIINDSYCKRVDSLGNFREINRDIARGESQYKPFENEIEKKKHFIGNNTVISPKTTIGPYSIVGEGTTIGDKSSVKNSVIGNNCIIGNNVKIANCTIMDNVKIEDGTKVQNSILSDGVFLHPNCEVKNCTLAANYKTNTKDIQMFDKIVTNVVV